MVNSACLYNLSFVTYFSQLQTCAQSRYIIGHLCSYTLHNTIGQCSLYHESHTAVSLALYAVDKGLQGWNILQSVVIDSAMYLLTISLPNMENAYYEPLWQHWEHAQNRRMHACIFKVKDTLTAVKTSATVMDNCTTYITFEIAFLFLDTVLPTWLDAIQNPPPALKISVYSSYIWDSDKYSNISKQCSQQNLVWLALAIDGELQH